MRFLTRRGPEILTGLGIVGLFGAGIMAVEVTPKVVRLIEEVEQDEELTKKDIMGLAWKYYIPSMATAVISAGCIIGAKFN